jgi:hypothetical protein
MADALTLDTTYSSVQGRARLLPWVQAPVLLSTGRALLSYPHGARPSLCLTSISPAANKTTRVAVILRGVPALG